MLPYPSIDLSPKTNNLTTGATRQLVVTVDPVDHPYTVVLESSDELIANVTQGGLVTAVGVGSCTIRAKVGDTIISESQVSVT